MLATALTRVWLAAALAAVLLLAVACRGEGPGPGAEDTSVAVPDTLTPIPSAAAASGSDEAPGQLAAGSVSFWNPKSLYDLVRVYRIIVVGRVTGVLVPCDNRPGYLGQPTPDIDYSDCPPDPEQVVNPPAELKHCLVPSPSPEELSRPPGSGYSVYSVEVQQVIASESLRPGDTIGVWQPGGICVDTPAEVAAAYDPQVDYEYGYETMMQAGSTYLFFLEPFLDLKHRGIPEPSAGTYGAPPFGRFLIGPDDRLQVVAKVWTCSACVAPKALAGKTVAEAEATLRPVIAEAALAPTPVSELDTP